MQPYSRTDTASNRRWVDCHHQVDARHPTSQAKPSGHGTTRLSHCAALGKPEYWQFDKKGEFHGTRLAGDRLVDWTYKQVEIEKLHGGVLQGYICTLKLQ